MSSMFSSSSSPVGSAASGWGSGSVGVMDVTRCAINLASLLGFLSNVELIISSVFGLWSTWPSWETGSRDPPTSKRGSLVESFYTLVNISGNFSM